MVLHLCDTTICMSHRNNRHSGNVCRERVRKKTKVEPLADFNLMREEVRIHWRAAFCLTKRRDTGTKRPYATYALVPRGGAQRCFLLLPGTVWGGLRAGVGKESHHRFPSLLCSYFCSGKITTTLKVKTYKRGARTQGQCQFRRAKILVCIIFLLSPSFHYPTDHPLSSSFESVINCLALLLAL